MTKKSIHSAGIAKQKQTTKFRSSQCRVPWTGLYIDFDKSVKAHCFCSNVLDKNFTSLAEAWNGAEMQNYRKEMQHGGFSTNCSGKCSKFGLYPVEPHWTDKRFTNMTIVIPWHENLEELRQTLISLSYQTSRDFNVIVSDDSDNKFVTPALVKMADWQRTVVNLNVSIVRSQPNIGTDKCIAQGINAAGGNIIRLLMPGDIADKDAVRREIELAYKKAPADKQNTGWLTPYAPEK